MTSSKKPPGNIHRIREFELEKIHLIDEFDILQIVGEGWFGKILLVEHRASDTEMVLKAVPKPYVSLRDFYREFHYGLHLGIHRNIVTTYDVAFETAGFYVFTQEYAPLGDLTSNVTDTGIGELHSKRVAKQIASALDYMHSKDIVHRDVKLDNVLIYRSDFSRVKLCDFGESYQTGTVVERRNEWLPYSPPEVLQIKSEGTYKAESNHDVWQFAIVVFVCLTGCLPWQKAASDDPRYMRYLAWQGTMVLPLRRTPKLFKLLTSKASRMFRRFLEPRADRRPKSLADLSKFVDDRWLAKSAEKDMAEYEPDELCPSMYSFHSSPEEKNRLLYTLAEHGIETTVDRQTKKNRIRDWIESSVINEDDEDEENESNSVSPSSSVSREPVPGHISSLRATESASKQFTTTVKDSSKKHFDPRTGVLQEGPSAMGANFYNSMDQLSNQNNGSLITLGSRTDLIASNGQNYMSDMSVNNLGKPLAQPMVNARLNIPLNNANNQNSENVDNKKYYKETVDLNYDSSSASKTSAFGKTNNLQRTKSDSAKQAAMLAHQKQFASSSALNYASNYGNGLQTGISNAFQSLATISIPNEQLLNNNTLINSQVKDSGYGSYDKIKTPNTNVSPAQLQTPTYRSPSKSSSSNPNSNVFNRDNYRTSGSNNNSSMKDTPYDRILAANRRIK